MGYVRLGIPWHDMLRVYEGYVGNLPKDPKRDVGNYQNVLRET